MKRLYTILFILVVINCGSFSQAIVRTSDLMNAVRSDTATGELRIIQDPRVDTLLSRQIAVNRDAGGIPGYRILIYRRGHPGARQEADRIVQDIYTRLPGLAVYLDFESPDYWIVRAGDYRTRIEATKAITAVKRHYPDAYIVRTRINIPQHKSVN